MKKKIIRNVVFSSVGFFWPLLLALFATPYIVEELGRDKYGLFSLVIAVAGFLAFLDIGMGAATIKYIPEKLACGEKDAVNQIMGTALTVYTVMGLLGSGMVWLLTPFLVNKVFNFPEALRNVTILCFYIGAAGFFMNMVTSVFAAAIKAIQRFDIISIVSIGFSTITILGFVVLLYFGYGIVAVVVYNFVIGLLSLLVYRELARRLLPGIFLWPLFHYKWFKKLFNFGFFSMISSLGGVILFQLHKILLGIFIGPGAVTLFTVPQNLSMKIHGMAARASEVFFPLLSELHGTGQIIKIKEIYLRAMRLLSVVFLTGFIPFLPLARPFLELWMGQDFARDSWLIFTFLLVAYVILAFSVIPYNLLHGFGLPKVAAFFTLFEAIATTILGLIIIPRFGAVGAAAIVLLVYLDVFVGLYYIERYVLDLKGISTFRQVYFRPLLASIVGMFIVHLRAERIAFSWFTLFILYAIGVLSTLLVNILLGTIKPELEIARTYLNHKLQPK